MQTPYGELEPGRYEYGDTVVTVSTAGWTESPKNPPAIQFIAPYDFLGLFTQSELVAVLSSVDPVIMVARAKVQTITTFVDLFATETQQYIGYLSQQGILTEARAARILSGHPPE